MKELRDSTKEAMKKSSTPMKVSFTHLSYSVVQ